MRAKHADNKSERAEETKKRAVVFKEQNTVKKIQFFVKDHGSLRAPLYSKPRAPKMVFFHKILKLNLRPAFM
jgi:phage-related protein